MALNSDHYFRIIIFIFCGIEKLQHYKDICKVSGAKIPTKQDKINLNNRSFFVGWVNRTENLCHEIGIKKFWSDSEIRDLIKSWEIHAKHTPQYNW